MPIPSPNSNEDKNTFISRCMGSDVMKKEFPDQKQRAAVCYSKWKKKEKKSKYEVDDIVIYEGKIGKIIRIIE